MHKVVSERVIDQKTCKRLLEESLVYIVKSLFLNCGYLIDVNAVCYRGFVKVI